MEISLVPTAGLCNRINTILNAIALHDKYNDYNIKIFWEKNKDCYADFYELFIPLSINGISLKPLTHIYLKPECKSNLYIPR